MLQSKIELYLIIPFLLDVSSTLQPYVIGQKSVISVSSYLKI